MRALVSLVIVAAVAVVSAAISSERLSDATTSHIAWHFNSINYTFTESARLPQAMAFVAVQTTPLAQFVIINGTTGVQTRSLGSLGANTTIAAEFFFWVTQTDDRAPTNLAFISFTNNQTASSIVIVDVDDGHSRVLWESSACAIAARPEHSIANDRGIIAFPITCGDAQTFVVALDASTAELCWNVTMPYFAMSTEVRPTTQGGYVVSAVGESDAWLAFVKYTDGSIVWNSTLSWPYYVTQSRPVVDLAAGVVYVIRGRGSIQGFYTEELDALDAATGSKRASWSVVVGETCKLVQSLHDATRPAVVALSCYHQSTSSPGHFRLVRIQSPRHGSDGGFAVTLNFTFTATLDAASSSFPGATALSEKGDVAVVALAGPADAIVVSLDGKGVLDRIHVPIEGGEASVVPFVAADTTVVLFQHWNGVSWHCGAFGVTMG